MRKAARSLSVNGIANMIILLLFTPLRTFDFCNFSIIFHLQRKKVTRSIDLYEMNNNYEQQSKLFKPNLLVKCEIFVKN